MVLFRAHAKYIHYSPYKLRPIVDLLRRQRDAQYALNILATFPTRRVEPIQKVLKSAVANAYNLQQIAAGDLVIKDFRVDQGPIFKYFKPAAMGRAKNQRKRFSHISVILEPKKQKNKEDQ